MGNVDQAGVQKALKEQRDQNIQEQADRMFLAMQTDQGAREQVQALAESHPSLFGGDTFGVRLGQTSPAAMAAAAQQARDAEETSREADEQYARQLEAQKQAQKQLAERRKRVEHEQRVEDEGIIDQANAEDRAARDQERATQRARTQAERDRKQAERDTARTARESTPEARGRQREAADKNALWAEAQRVNQANMCKGGRRRLLNTSRGSWAGPCATGGWARTIAQAVEMAIGQLEQQTADEFARGMQQQYRSYQNLGGRY